MFESTSTGDLSFSPHISHLNWHRSISPWNDCDSKSEKNRKNLWVMTHDFVIYFSEIIDFPLRFCWYSWFLGEIKILSGNQRFFGIKVWISRILGFSTFFQNLSGNDIILRKRIENFVNYAHQSKLNLVLSAEIKCFWIFWWKKCEKNTLIFINTFKRKLVRKW